MDVKEYFDRHSLKEEFVKERGWEWSDTTITIPVFDPNGKFLYNKYRHLTGDYKFTADKGAHPALYCSEHISQLKEVVLCEGEPDCIRLWQENIPAVTGTFGVATFNKQLANQLTGKKVYLILDTDQAGQESVAKYCETLLEANALPLIINLPDEYKDISEYLTDGHDKAEIDQFKKTAQTYEDWQEAHQPEQFNIETGVELINKEFSPEEWLVDRVIPSDGFTFIVGAEATGKSFYTLTLAHSIATGTPWLDKFTIGKQTNVLFIDKENSSRRRQARIKGLHLNDSLPHLHWLTYPEYFSLADEKSSDGISPFAHFLSKQVEKLKIGLIIIDSFADLMVGNENSSGDVQQFFDVLRKLFPNKAILVLHHENKPSQGITRTSSQRVRGSTNITAQIVSGFRVFPIPKTTNEFVLEQFKAGDAEKIKPFKIELVTLPSPYDPTKTYVSQVKYNGEYFDQEGQAELAEEAITDFFSETPTSPRKEIVEHCIGNGVSERTVNTVLAKMVQDGLLEKVRVGKSVSYLWK